MKPLFSYIDGKYLQGAKISAQDIGFLRGFGVFDFLRTYGGKPFHLHDHLQRLRHSAKLLMLPVEKSDEEISEIVFRLLHINELKEANIRLIITGGESFDQLLPSGKTSFFVLAHPFTPYPKHLYEEGISLATFPIERFLPECKSLNYISAILALQHAKKIGAFEVLYVNNKNHLLECSTCNFFVFKKGSLITPEKEILPGITRKIVLDLAKQEFPLEKRVLEKSELEEIDEAFITASNKEILPVVKIDHKNVGTGIVGKKTKKLMSLFQEHTIKSTAL